jgi:hypothetical protein
VVAIKDLPKEVQKLLNDTGSHKDEDTQQKAVKRLRKLGYDVHGSQTILLDRKKKAKDVGGTVWLSPNFDEGNIAIVGHQHCQPDMFPLLKKIADHFGEEVQAYDGGSIQDYEEWLENQGESNE